jgi:hypothetical protein
MNAYTQDLFETVYASWAERNQRRRKNSRESTMPMDAFHQDVLDIHRQRMLERRTAWADRIIAQVSRQQLATKIWRVWELVVDVVQHYEPPAEEDGAFFTAYALAVLRGHHLAAAGRIEGLEYTYDDLRQFIENKTARQ